MLNNYLQQQLESENTSLDEFKELLIRLLNWGILCRKESQTEQVLYDRFLRIANVIEEYLSVMDIKVFHDARFEFVRLYPPGSQVPGMEEAETSAYSGSLRNRLGQNEVALILVLRIQYDKALREGQVDEHGYVTESLESIAIAMKNILNRSLPEKLTERKKLFTRLNQLRLIELRKDDDVENTDAWLRIHPMIANFVNDDAIQVLRDQQSDEEIKEATEESLSENS